MTTREHTSGMARPSPTTSTTAEVANRPSGNMKARMWIGQNPVPFVVACLMGGYWMGRSMGRP